MTGLDDRLRKAIAGLDAEAALTLLRCLQRFERGECSPEEAVEDFEDYCRNRQQSRGAGPRKSLDGDEA